MLSKRLEKILRLQWEYIFCAILFFLAFATVSGAQIKTSNLRDKKVRDISMERVIDTDSEPYVREREIILKQLDIITGDEETRYIIIPGDTLDISFNDRSDVVNAVYQVSGDGEINLPLAGAIKVSDLNRKQAREKIDTYLKEYIRNPNTQVFVNISGRYMVAGEVEDPGVFRLRPNLTAMEAILGARFDRDEVNLKSVLVMRGTYDKPIVRRLDLDKMLRKGDRSDNIIIKPGDFIYVPKRFIANIEQFVKTVYRYVKAYYGLGRIPGEPIDADNKPGSVFFK